MQFPPEFIKQIKDTSDIIELAQEYFPLTKHNTIYQAQCIHEGDNSPSLTFFPDTQSFYCFGCGAGSKQKTKGSDVIDFVMWIDKCSYAEAVVKLAGRKGLALPTKELTKEEKEKQRLMLECLKLNRQYWTNLQAEPEILKYLNDRGITQESIDAFRIGYVPKEDQSKASNRIVFAIMDDWGRTIGFSYRNMEDHFPNPDKPDQGPKYFNSAKSLIFDKGSVLYGLHNIRKMIREKGYMVIAEGFGDTILGQKYGCPFVSTMGTSLTKEHIAIIKKYTRMVIVWYDGDEGGITSTLRHLVPLRNEGLIVKVLNTPGDPDDKIMEVRDGLEEFILSNARMAGQYEVDLVMGKYRSQMSEMKFRLLEELRSVFKEVKSQTEVQTYAAQVARELGIDPQVFIEEMMSGGSS